MSAPGIAFPPAPGQMSARLPRPGAHTKKHHGVAVIDDQHLVVDVGTEPKLVAVRVTKIVPPAVDVIDNGLDREVRQVDEPDGTNPARTRRGQAGSCRAAYDRSINSTHGRPAIHPPARASRPCPPTRPGALRTEGGGARS